MDFIDAAPVSFIEVYFKNFVSFKWSVVILSLIYEFIIVIE